MRNVATSLLLLLLAGGAVLAQDANEQPLSGRVQPVQVTELRVDLEGYGGELKLKTLLAPGMAVKKGDVVAELEAPDYKDALDRARENVTLSEMTAKQLEDSLNYAEESYKQQLERAQRNADRAAQDYDYFVNKQRKETIRNSELGLESAENNITDQEEELKQLESLYKGNDLAKESQDIVLNRSKRRLKVSKERYGQEDGRQHDDQRNDRSGHFRHGQLRGFLWRVSILNVPGHVFHDHNRIIHDNTDRQNEGKQGECVDGKFKWNKENEGADQGNRNSKNWYKSCPPTLQKQKHHQYDQQQSQKQGVQYFIHRRFDHSDGFQWHEVVDVFGEILFELCQGFVYSFKSG